MTPQPFNCKVLETQEELSGWQIDYVFVVVRGNKVCGVHNGRANFDMFYHDFKETQTPDQGWRESSLAENARAVRLYDALRRIQAISAETIGQNKDYEV